MLALNLLMTTVNWGGSGFGTDRVNGDVRLEPGARQCVVPK